MRTVTIPSQNGILFGLLFSCPIPFPLVLERPISKRRQLCRRTVMFPLKVSVSCFSQPPFLVSLASPLTAVRPILGAMRVSPANRATRP